MTPRSGRDRFQLLRFLLVGGLNTAFGYSVFALMTWFGFSPPIAIGASTVLGILFNFQSTGRLVFGQARRSLLWRFVAAYAVVYGLNVMVLKALVLAGLGPYVANALLILPLAIVAYLLQKKFVFTSA